jgi:hypothetical protein
MLDTRPHELLRTQGVSSRSCLVFFSGNVGCGVVFFSGGLSDDGFELYAECAIALDLLTGPNAGEMATAFASEGVVSGFNWPTQGDFLRRSLPSRERAVRQSSPRWWSPVLVGDIWMAPESDLQRDRFDPCVWLCRPGHDRQQGAMLSTADEHERTVAECAHFSRSPRISLWFRFR